MIHTVRLIVIPCLLLMCSDLLAKTFVCPAKLNCNHVTCTPIGGSKMDADYWKIEFSAPGEYPFVQAAQTIGNTSISCTYAIKGVAMAQVVNRNRSNYVPVTDGKWRMFTSTKGVSLGGGICESTDNKDCKFTLVTWQDSDLAK